MRTSDNSPATAAEGAGFADASPDQGPLASAQGNLAMLTAIRPAPGLPAAFALMSEGAMEPAGFGLRRTRRRFIPAEAG